MDVINKYAVLRIVPDERRGERVNIGLIVLKDTSIDVRLISSMSKVSALDGSIDLGQILALPSGIESWLSATRGADAKYQTLRNSGLVSVSELGWFNSLNNVEYEATLMQLMNKLVEPKPSPSKTSTGNTKIASHLRQQFRSSKILGKVKSDIAKHLIVPNYPLAPDEGLYADFVLKNGVYRVTETADFRAESGTSSDRRRIAADAAIKLDTAKKLFRRKGVRRYAVVGVPRGNGATQAVNLLEKYVDEIFDVESKSEMARYMQKMLEAANESLALSGQ